MNSPTDSTRDDAETQSPPSDSASPAESPKIFRFAAAMLVGTGSFFLLAAALNKGGGLPDFMDRRQVIGTCLLFMLVPTYLLSLQLYQRWRGPQLVKQLAHRARANDLELVLERYQKLDRRWATVAILVGLFFGLSQNRFVLEYLLGEQAVSTMDLAFFVGNGLLWAVAFLLLSWKLYIGLALNRLGQHCAVDVYHLNELRPLGVLATLDVLAVAGSMAFMPLQALDAQFRWENYQWGLLVGIPSALALFLLPLLGIRQAIRAAKERRLDDLARLQLDLPRGDIGQLELHAAHEHRIQALPNWPIDLQLVTRVLVYVVLPPLAWVAAALVEQLIDRVT